MNLVRFTVLTALIIFTPFIALASQLNPFMQHQKAIFFETISHKLSTFKLSVQNKAVLNSLRDHLKILETKINLYLKKLETNDIDTDELLVLVINQIEIIETNPLFKTIVPANQLDFLRKFKSLKKKEEPGVVDTHLDHDSPTPTAVPNKTILDFNYETDTEFYRYFQQSFFQGGADVLSFFSLPLLQELRGNDQLPETYQNKISKIIHNFNYLTPEVEGLVKAQLANDSRFQNPLEIETIFLDFLISVIYDRKSYKNNINLPRLQTLKKIDPNVLDRLALNYSGKSSILKYLNINIPDDLLNEYDYPELMNLDYFRILKKIPDSLKSFQNNKKIMTLIALGRKQTVNKKLCKSLNANYNVSLNSCTCVYPDYYFKENHENDWTKIYANSSSSLFLDPFLYPEGQCLSQSLLINDLVNIYYHNLNRPLENFQVLSSTVNYDKTPPQLKYIRESKIRPHRLKRQNYSIQRTSTGHLINTDQFDSDFSKNYLSSFVPFLMDQSHIGYCSYFSSSNALTEWIRFESEGRYPGIQVSPYTLARDSLKGTKILSEKQGDFPHDVLSRVRQAGILEYDQALYPVDDNGNFISELDSIHKFVHKSKNPHHKKVVSKIEKFYKKFKNTHLKNTEFKQFKKYLYNIANPNTLLDHLVVQHHGPRKFDVDFFKNLIPFHFSPFLNENETPTIANGKDHASNVFRLSMTFTLLKAYLSKGQSVVLSICANRFALESKGKKVGEKVTCGEHAILMTDLVEKDGKWFAKLHNSWGNIEDDIAGIKDLGTILKNTYTYTVIPSYKIYSKNDYTYLLDEFRNSDEEETIIDEIIQKFK